MEKDESHLSHMLSIWGQGVLDHSEGKRVHKQSERLSAEIWSEMGKVNTTSKTNPGYLQLRRLLRSNYHSLNQTVSPEDAPVSAHPNYSAFILTSP